MEFFKYQGCGNDYIYIDCFNKNIENPNEFAKKISDRNFGVGSDGLILMLPSSEADAQMRIFNADGSEAEMCGNGIRCMAKYIFDNKKNSQENIVTIETLSGIRTLELIDHNEKVSRFRVNMGTPMFLDSFFLEKDVCSICQNISDKPCNYISMGNSHLILFCPNIDFFNIKSISENLQSLPHFMKGININFVEIESYNSIRLRVFERGSGETLSCGTGACASAAAAVLNGFCNNKLIVKFRGGRLLIEYIDNLVYMTGDATFVFKGEYYCD